MQSLWMLFASFVFAIMGVCVKLASAFYSTSEIVMYRGLVGVIVIYGLIKLRGGSLKTRLPWQHVGRGAVGVTALWLWFYAIGTLPLAMAMTLNYTAPIWMAAFLFASGWWLGKSRFEWGLLTAILFSFLGVTLLLQPAFQADQWFSGIVALISGMLSAMAYLQVRRLGKLGEPEYRVVFYFSATGLVAGLLGCLATPLLPVSSTVAPVMWHSHTIQGVTWLLGVGLCAAIAQMAMTRAYRLGNTLVTANLQYSGIVFSSIWGILIWSDLLGASGWLGIAIILASGITATYYNTRATARNEPPATDAIASEV
jgi:S-adenosylmethionine uptake transporter